MPSSPDPDLVIDCDDCALQHTAACSDCVVSFLCGVEAGNPVVVDLAEARAIRMLDTAGLVPPLRHTRHPGQVGHVHRTGSGG